MAAAKKRCLIVVFNRLLDKFGPRRWWPADSAFEVVVGAILTQNTSWNNVSRAVDSLKKQRLLDPKRLSRANTEKIERLIRPTGYFRVKTKRLKQFLEFLNKNYDGDLKKLFKKPIPALRKELLGVKGIGPETADSIILYAAQKPIFVVDAYTKRILSRHRLIAASDNYDSIQSMFMRNLPKDAKLFNEYHALLVQLGKDMCRKRPHCEICPLKDLKRRENRWKL